MKTQKKLFQKPGRVILTLFLLSAIIFACNDEIVETENWQQERSEMQLKSKVIREGTVQLEGFTRFAFYVKNERYYITDGYTSNFLKCEATLTFNGGQEFTLTTTEIMDLGQGPFVYREVTFEGKITPSGQLKFNWPEKWFEAGSEQSNVAGLISAHTGFVLHGAGVNKSTICYKGQYNGKTFFADMHLNAKQESNIPFGEIEGPVLVNFMIDLKVVD